MPTKPKLISVEDWAAENLTIMDDILFHWFFIIVFPIIGLISVAIYGLPVWIILAFIIHFYG